MTTAMTEKETADEIRPGERRELKSLVKMKIKALRTEVDERYAAQMAEISARVALHFKEDDERITAFDQRLDEITTWANAQAAKVFGEFADLIEQRTRDHYSRPYYTRRQTRRNELRAAMTKAIEAERASAYQRLTRLETEMLESLTLDALKTEAAKQFVREIPGIEALMPARRLAEIEASFVGNSDGS